MSKSEATPPGNAPAPTAAGRRRRAFEAMQMVAVAAFAAAVGVGIVYLLQSQRARGTAPGTDRPAAGATGPTATSPSFVVIDSDAIGAKALATVQQAFRSDPRLMPHLGDIGRIVGKDVQQAAQGYAAQGEIVYRASSLLAYPVTSDRTAVVQQHVMADVQAMVQRWSAQPSAQVSPTPAASHAQPGFEP